MGVPVARCRASPLARLSLLLAVRKGEDAGISSRVSSLSPFGIQSLISAFGLNMSEIVKFTVLLLSRGNISRLHHATMELWQGWVFSVSLLQACFLAFLPSIKLKHICLCCCSLPFQETAV